MMFNEYIQRLRDGFSRLYRSRNFWGYVCAAVICAIISIAFFYPDAIQGNELKQYDIQQGSANGHETQQWLEATGERPRWTNSLFSGMPTFQISPSYPSDSMFRWIDTVMRAGLPSPSGLLFSMMAGFIILTASMRMRWYYALIGAIAWGLSSYFIILIGAGHLWKFITLAYVPPVIGGIILAYNGRWLSGGAIASLFAMMQISSNHVQMSYYFSFLIIGLVIAYLISSYTSKNLAGWGKATGALAIAAVLAVGANLPSLYNTYAYSKETTRGKSTELSEAGKSAGLDKDYITMYSYGRAESFTLLVPNVKGGASIKPVGGELHQLTLADLPDAQSMIADGKADNFTAQYLGYVSQYFGEPESTNGPVYVGAIICALFLLGCFIVRGPLKWTLLALTVLSLLLAMGRNCMWLTDLFIDYFPLYNRFRTPESILVIAQFCMPLLGVLALHRWFTTADAWSHYNRQFIAAFGIVSLLCLLGVFFPGIYGEAVTESDLQISSMIGRQLTQQGYPAEAVSAFSIDNPVIYSAVERLRHGMVEADSLRSLIFIVAAAILLWGVSSKHIKSWLAISGVAVLVLADMYTVDKRYLDHDSFCTPAVSSADPFPLSASDKAILADTAIHYRVMDIPRFYHPSPSYHHKAVGGYHAAKLTRYQDMIERHLSHFTTGRISDADYNILDMLNAKYVIGPDGQLSENPGALGNAWLVSDLKWVETPVEEMEALDEINPAVTAVADSRFKDVLKAPAAGPQPGDTIRLTEYAPDRLVYHASVSAPALAAFSEVYFPWGWKATVDGQEVPVGRIDYLLRAVNIPAGDHTIVMSFDPPSLHTTVAVAYISVILIFMWVIVALFRHMAAVPHKE